MKRLLSLITCWAFLLAQASAQEPRIQNRPYLDTRFLHYGFFVGVDMMDLELTNNGYVDVESGEQWYTEVDNYQPGFVVGVLGELRLSKYVGLRLQPAIHFGQKHIVFHEQLSGRDSTQNLKSTYLTVPIALKIAAPRYNNFRPYISVGVAPTIDLTARKNFALRTEVLDCYLEFAAGCDIYLPFFKLIPELRFSFGLRDILVHERDDLTDASLLKFTKSLERGRSKMITLAFYFE
ncbi:MAG: PorT family protein [Bacteroidaceae bacterium]|nr:PorT family protein [Bacteroidaceae bacterium]